MFLTKIYLDSATSMPIIGERSNVVEEVSKRFAKYYRRGIKSENRNKILGYNLLIPKAFLKFKSTFREDLMMMEVHVNKKSSILIPSFYSSREKLNMCFQLEENMSLKKVFDFSTENNDEFLKEFKLNFANPASARLSTRADSSLNIGAFSVEDQDGRPDTKGRAKGIRQFTNQIFSRYYDKEAQSILGKIFKGAMSGGKFILTLNGTLDPVLMPIYNMIKDAAVGPDALIKSNLDSISCKKEKGPLIPQLETKTKEILNKVFDSKDSENKDKFIDQVVSIYKRPDNVSQWIKSLVDADASRLMQDELDIYETTTQVYSTLIETYEDNLPKSLAAIQNEKKPRNITSNDKMNVFNQGILNVTRSGAARKLIKIITLGKLKKLNEYLDSLEYSMDIKKFDSEIASKLEKSYVSIGMSKKEIEDNIDINKISLGGIRKLWKATTGTIILIMLTGAVAQSITGKAVLTAPLDAGLAAIEYVAEEGLELAGITDEKNQTPLEKTHKATLAVAAQVEGAKAPEIMEIMKTPKQLRKACDSLDLDDELKEVVKAYMEILISQDFNAESFNNELYKSIKFLSKKIDSKDKDITNGPNSDLLIKIALSRGDNPKNMTKNDIIGLRIVLSSLISDKAGPRAPGLKDQSSIKAGLPSMAAQAVAGNDEFMEALDDVTEIYDALQKKFQGVKFSYDQYKTIKEITGVQISKAWGEHMNKNIYDSSLIKVIRHTTFVPPLIIKGIMEEKFSDSEITKFMKAHLDNPEDFERSEAIFMMFWILILGGYFRNTGEDLNKRVARIVREISSKQNLFRVYEVSNAVSVVQMVLWASFTEDFKKLSKSETILQKAGKNLKSVFKKMFGTEEIENDKVEESNYFWGTEEAKKWLTVLEKTSKIKVKPAGKDSDESFIFTTS